MVSKMTYKVLVDDNFAYMDEGSRYTHGSYDTAVEAIAAAKSIVDSALESLNKEGFTVDQLYDQYKSFGEDPFIVSEDKSVSFSAWDYARERCNELCRQSSQTFSQKPFGPDSNI